MANTNYYATNPADARTTYSYVSIERTTDSSSSPNPASWAEITRPAISTSDEFTLYVDTGGSSSSWYRHRWSTAATAGTYSDYSDSIQAGDSQIRQWIMADIPDSTIVAATWQRWIDQTLIDLFSYNIWLPQHISVTPTTTSNVVDEYYVVPQLIRDVYGVEAVATSGNASHKFWLDPILDWVQMGRQVRLFNATTSYNYVLHGKGIYTSVGLLTYDFFMLAYHMVRLKYILYQVNQRANYRQFIVMDRVSDITVEQLRSMQKDEEGQIEWRRRALSIAEPAVGGAMGSSAY